MEKNNTTVVTSVGQTVYLYCGVHNLGERAVRNKCLKISLDNLPWHLLPLCCPVRHIQNSHISSIEFYPLLLLELPGWAFWSVLASGSFLAMPRFCLRLTGQSQSVSDVKQLNQNSFSGVLDKIKGFNNTNNRPCPLHKGPKVDGVRKWVRYLFAS